MTYILNIETSTTVCSVSLSKNGELISYREINNGFTHAENLHLFIQEVLADKHIATNRLNAVAVSKGPGSYTGLRIGVSAAKGLAFALNIPLISIDTLQLMCNHPLVPKTINTFCCPMIDARRMEVYTCIYNLNLLPQVPIEALVVDEISIQKFKPYAKINFFGDGMDKCAEILKTLPNAEFIKNINPTAQYMCSLSYKKFTNQNFENVAYFEPFYLKDFLLKRP